MKIFYFYLFPAQSRIPNLRITLSLYIYIYLFFFKLFFFFKESTSYAITAYQTGDPEFLYLMKWCYCSLFKAHITVKDISTG